MSKVIAMLVLGLLTYYWSVTQKLKSLAILAAKKRCRESQVQFLDHTVVFNRHIWFKNSAGKRVLQREYIFDFSSTGEQRYQGKVILQSHHIVDVELGVFSIN